MPSVLLVDLVIMYADVARRGSHDADRFIDHDVVDATRNDRSSTFSFERYEPVTIGSGSTILARITTAGRRSNLPSLVYGEDDRRRRW